MAFEPVSNRNHGVSTKYYWKQKITLFSLKEDCDFRPLLLTTKIPRKFSFFDKKKHTTLSDEYGFLRPAELDSM